MLKDITNSEWFKGVILVIMIAVLPLTGVLYANMRSDVSKKVDTEVMLRMIETQEVKYKYICDSIREQKVFNKEIVRLIRTKQDK